MERLKTLKKLIIELNLRIWKLLMKQSDCVIFSRRQAYIIVLAPRYHTVQFSQN
jgi:hypothetical protein